MHLSTGCCKMGKGTEYMKRFLYLSILTATVFLASTVSLFADTAIKLDDKKKWNYNNARITVTFEDGLTVINSLAGTNYAATACGYNFTLNDENGENYLQFRAGNKDSLCTLSFTGLGSLSQWMRIKPGIYSFPAYNILRPDLKNKPLKGVSGFRFDLSGEIAISNMKMCLKNSQDVISFTVKKPDGTIRPTAEAIMAGDTVRIEMTVAAKPDRLALTLFKLDTTDNWAKKGMWTLLSIPGVPLELKCDKEYCYYAEFKVPYLKQAISAPKRAIIAGIEYAGGDAHNYGWYYGICGHPFNIQEGEKNTITSRSLRILDFGPLDGPVHEEAEGINENTMSPEFKWLLTPTAFRNSNSRCFDELMNDWAEIGKGKTTELEVKVPPGRYKVITGIGGIITNCWLYRNYLPLSGSVSVNGKTVFSREGTEAERWRLMDQEAKCNDDIFDVFFPHVMEIPSIADCPDGKLRIRVTADKRNIPLNYVAFYPIDDKSSAAHLANIQARRKVIFKQYWTDISPNKKILTSEKTIADFPPKKKGFLVYARANPYALIFPETLPDKNEVETPLRLTAMKGEKVVGTVLLHAFENLQNVTAKCNIFSPEILYIHQYHFAHAMARKHWIGPNQLTPFRNRNLAAGQSHGIMFEFRIPQDCDSGLKTGLLTFSANGEKHELPVEIRVFDKLLPELTDHPIAVQGSNGNWLNDMKFAREYLGCTTHHFAPIRAENNRFELDAVGMPVKITRIGTAGAPADLRKWFEDYKKIDFPVRTPIIYIDTTRPDMPHSQGQFKPFTPGWEKALILHCSAMRDMAVNSGACTGIIADTGGELGYNNRVPNAKTIQDSIRIFKFLETIPGIIVSHRCNDPGTTKEFAPYLDFMGVRGSYSWPVSDKVTDYGKKKHLYTYSVGGRFLNGIHSWAHGARGNLREWLTFSHSIEFNDFLCTGCGPAWHFEAMPGPNNTLIPTLHSESFRVSVVDRQYLRLLENNIHNSRYPEAKTNAEAFLSILKKSILDVRTGEYLPEFLSIDNPWQGIRMDVFRRIIALCIDELDTGKQVLPRFKAVKLEEKESLAPIQPEKEIRGIPPEARPDYDDFCWQDIMVGCGWEQLGYQYDGEAWYRIRFQVPSGWTKPILYFGAVDEESWTYLNGRFYGYAYGWDKPFQYELANVVPDGENVLSVKVFDSVAQGGIWRPIILYKNVDSAKAGKDGILLKKGKILFQPGKRNLNCFDFEEGLFYPEGCDVVSLKITLFPQNDAEFSELKKSPVVLKLYDEKGTEVRKTELRNIEPYRQITRSISLREISRGAYKALLTVGQKSFAEMTLYIIGMD